jgi:cell wall-associated NlpC family hydrolase
VAKIKPERQENGSLTGVKKAGEGAQGITAQENAASQGVAMTTGAFGEGAFNASTPDAAVGSDTFGDIWGQIEGQTSFSTSESGGGTSLSVTGNSPSAGGGRGNKSLVDFAKQFLGTPYVWGGTSPSGFDCSGFTQYVMKQFGVNLPRISYQQGSSGKAVGSGDLRPGDLVFWDNSSRNRGADHVGIYIGGGKYIHAPAPGQSVKISSLGGNYWARRYGAASNAASTNRNWGQNPV